MKFIMSALIAITFLAVASCTLLFKPDSTCQEATIIGDPLVGCTLEGRFETDPPELKDQNMFDYAWYRSVSETSELSRIEGAETGNYTLTKQDAGHYVFFEVIPRNPRGKQAESCISEGIGPIEFPPAIMIRDAVLDSESTTYNQEIVVEAANLGTITAYEIVIAYDPDQIEWNGFSAISNIGGLTISELVETEMLHYAYFAASSLNTEIKDLTTLATFFFKTWGATPDVNIMFSKCSLSGGLQVETTVRPKIEFLSLFQGHISIQ